MRNRIVWFIVGSVLVYVLVMVGSGIGLVFAVTHGAFGTHSTVQAASQSKPVFGATQVYMRDDVFTPAYIQVVPGTTVTWTNQDSVSHNVTLSPVVITASGNWKSDLLYQGQSFSFTFTSRGTFQYYCQEHPSEMLGRVIVT